MIADAQHRRSAVEQTGLSIAVEASAGTGKTTTLVERILQLVLVQGPEGRPLGLREICAITFTEKAAGEMKTRLRRELENRSTGEGDAAGRAREMLQELDAAAISTFHAFAVSLLKERPFEAHLDPRFTVLDEIQGDTYYGEVWETWLQRAIEVRHPVLAEALRFGIRLEDLEKLADTLRRHSAAVRQLRLQPPPTDRELQERCQRLLDDGRLLVPLARRREDRLFGSLQEALEWLADPDLTAEIPGSAGNLGVQAGWEGGKATVQLVRRYLSSVKNFRCEAAAIPGQRLVDGLAHWLVDGFLPEWEARKRARGMLDFDDLLRYARNLLRSSRAARGEFHRRYRAVLVDEFQDTDQLQLELLLLLTCTDLDETDPAKLRPAPGRLFVVGDPKQSIYRFRGADIETYGEVVEECRIAELGLARQSLTTNMRSVPSILRFVDAAFQDVMTRPGDGYYQPDYLAFGGEGLRAGEPLPPSVHLLAERNDEGTLAGSGSGFIERESMRLARLIQRICASPQWAVESAGTGRRPPRYGDMAILLPVLIHADILEDCLRDAGIPYVLEGGKFYYTRSEVASAITVLRAVSNPNDRVALYGALRSIFFGLSDEDLLEAHCQRLELDYRSPVPDGSPLSRPYGILHELHRQRHARSAAETLETLLQRTGARDVLASHGFQSLANLAKLERTLRALQLGSTFSQIVGLLAAMDEEGADESESRLMEEQGDAVRIMSIHRSKGLDFPIVFVAGLGIQKRASPGDILMDSHAHGVYALQVGSSEGGVQTPGWKELVEENKKREDAELVRLLYVALTRARDYLIVSTHHKGKRSDAGAPADEGMDNTRLRPLAGFLRSGRLEQEALARFVDCSGLDGMALPRHAGAETAAKDWRARFRREYEELQRLVAGAMPLTPTVEAGAAAEFPPGAVRERAVRLGLAFHDVMEKVDFMSAAQAGLLARHAGARHGLDPAEADQISEMVRCCLDSPLLERARTALNKGKGVWRELPVVRPPSRGDGPPEAVEGKIDLLFEEEGGWVLVDYKTDQAGVLSPATEDSLRMRYLAQLQEYRAALTGLGIRVHSLYLLLARTGAALQIG